jgi:hypothetical protein
MLGHQPAGFGCFGAIVVEQDGLPNPAEAGDDNVMGNAGFAEEITEPLQLRLTVAEVGWV